MSFQIVFLKSAEHDLTELKGYMLEMGLGMVGMGSDTIFQMGWRLLAGARAFNG